MRKTTISKGFARNVVLFLLLFCAGVLITILIPVCGWIAGPIIIIASPFAGGSRRVWRCDHCRATIDRA